jgi:hypothetical protein
LMGFTFTDDATVPARSRVPSGFSVPPLGFVLVWADGINGAAITDTNLHVAFSLNKSGEMIGLYDGFGRQIDAATFGQQSNGISEGRWRDGATNRYFMPAPTPGASNVITNSAPALLSLVMDSATDVTLTWLSQPGRTYVIQSKSTLNEPVWSDLPGDVTAAATTCAVTLKISTSQSFYRISARD